MTLPAGYCLRFATKDEAGLLLDVMLRCWTGTVAADSTAYSETEAAIAGQLARGAAVVLSFRGEPVGAGRYCPVPGPEGDPREWVELKRVGVLKSYRKLGLGAPIVAALEARARACGFGGAQLGVRHDQPRLLAFWRSQGYATADDVELYTRNPLTPPPTTLRKRF